MKIKELIEKLKEIEAKEGDVEIYALDQERGEYSVETIKLELNIETGRSYFVNGKWIPITVSGWVIQ